MTKRDFQFIASALRGLAPDRAHPRESINPQQWADTVHALASALSESNPRFDRARFLAACGLAVEGFTSVQLAASARQCADCEIELTATESERCFGCNRIREIEENR